MPTKSRYTLVVENLSKATRSADIRYEMERFGDVVEVERDIPERCALVSFKRSDDCTYAWKKAEGMRVDGRNWKVDFANKRDFEFFDWEWSEENHEKRAASPGAKSPSTREISE